MQKSDSLRLGKWNKTENDKFMKALQKYGKNWNLIHKFVGTRSMPQVRSHAQKLFLGMSKNEMKSFEEELDNRFKYFCREEQIRQRKKERRSSMKTSTSENCQIKDFEGLDQNQKITYKEQNQNEENPRQIQEGKNTKQENKIDQSTNYSISTEQNDVKDQNTVYQFPNQSALNLVYSSPCQYGFYIIPQAPFFWMPY